MESPIKKVTFEEADKENIQLHPKYASDEVAVPVKGIPMQDEPELEVAATSVASAIKEEEASEPLLQENPQRFVLFPIRYHEVRSQAPDALRRVKW